MHSLAREARRERRRKGRVVPPREQVCTLFVPEANGYVLSFSPEQFRVTDVVEVATRFVGEEATTAAAAFRDITGLRVAIRPFYGGQRTA